jgi:hypothetical protein
LNQVGGSLAGLLAGVILKTVPQIETIKILERSKPEKLKDLGAGMRLGAEVVETLRECTSFPLERYAELLKTYRILGEQGEVLFENHSENWSTSWGRLFHGLRASFEESSGPWYQYDLPDELCRDGCYGTGIQGGGRI